MRAGDWGEYQLREYVSNSIKASYKVQPEYFPLIEEVIVRRALLYDFDISRVDLDLERGAKWLTKVKYEKYPKERNNFYGQYNKYEKSITFNKERTNSLNDGLLAFCYFAHEFSHALCMDGDVDGYAYDILSSRLIQGNDGKIRQSELNFYDYSYNNTWLELIVSKASERLIGKSYKLDNIQILYDYDSKNTYSYSSSSPILEMFETAIGLKEEELLSYYVNGRESIADELSKIIGSDIHTGYYELDQVELQYKVIHRLLYNNSKYDSNISKYNDFEKSFSKFYKKCLDLMERRIKTTKVKTIEDANLLCEQLKYEYNRLTLLANKFIDINRNYTESLLQGIDNIPDTQNCFKEDVFSIVKQQQQQMVVRIESMEEALGTNSTEDVVINSFDEARMLEFKEKQTILLRQDLRTFQFQVSQDTIDRNKEPDPNWNNTNIENIALNAINQKLKRKTKIKGFFKKIKDLFTLKSIWGESPRLLNSTQGDFLNELNNRRSWS